MLAKELESSVSSDVSCAALTSVVSAERSSVRHIGHLCCVAMTVVIQLMQNMCLHIVILTVSRFKTSIQTCCHRNPKNESTGQSSCASIARSITCCNNVTFSCVKSTVGAFASSIKADNRSRHKDQ